MSAITETELRGEIRCIVEFSARPRDQNNHAIAGDRRVFCIGERVRLVDSFDKRTPADNPTGPMAVFEPLEGEGRYAAPDTYFVAVDVWEGLREYFENSLAANGCGPVTGTVAPSA